MLNCFKYFLKYTLGQNVPKHQTWKIMNYIKSSCIIFFAKMTRCSLSFFSSFDIQKFHHLLGCHTIAINSSFIFFKCSEFFKFTTPSPKSEMNNSIRIILIKAIIIIKILLRSTVIICHWLAINVTLSRS